MTTNHVKNLGVLTSGGDAPGMNAAVRAVVRTALHQGVKVYAIHEGYQGMVDGGEYIKEMAWGDVGGILQQGGTVIGSARCQVFRSREGRLQAALNLLRHGINGLVIIGGDGSLTGANLFRQEWPELLAELVAQGHISQAVADDHPYLSIVGLVGSIDNDMFGTDMTIGADTALHRITEAIDAIADTAASHQRSFVVEVMGRHCGYLALMAGLATGADWVLIPESPPNVDDWEAKMCEVLLAGRQAGRRDSIVIVAEGAQDRYGKPISCEHVKQVLEERLGEDTRITILGHLQRGGSPSAFDRYLSTILGYRAVGEILSAPLEREPQLIGIRGHRVTYAPLIECVQQTRAIADVIAAHDYETAMEMRGGSFKDAFRTLRTLVRALPHPPAPGQRRLRLAIMHGGAPAPGMNTAVRAAVRLGIDKGHFMLRIEDGINGLINGTITPMTWSSVNGWAARGGAELGTSRKAPTTEAEYEAIATQIKKHQIEGILMIGGWAGYQAIFNLYQRRDLYPELNIPLICFPAAINNNLPGSDLSIGADTALNNIVEVVDKIKQSAVAFHRCFVVEVMGRYCGYLALMSGLATGAEQVYLHEKGIKLADLQRDLDQLIEGFKHGKRLGLMIRNEKANSLYTTDFMSSLFKEEGGGLFEVRQSVLGHLQQGGDPSPFDRIQATRLARYCIDFLIEAAGREPTPGVMVGLQGGHVQFTSLDELPALVDAEFQRPKAQWWLVLQQIAKVMSQPETYPAA